ncbi:HutD/Ves family protein [Taklimakanibacter lacteus]|uniref:HutD/Ves family protein n=1 Tax=Taklimakanibacter lacteus TaxID=2268456 RepID=UPI000E66325B
MRILRQGDYKVMPWKNGGGITTEIAAFPADAGLGGKPFQWRVSIADVASDGPFSTFAGYDRHIMLLEGKGMRLHAEEAGVIDLAVPYRPASFSGDWAVSGALIDGPVKDFNLMVARQSGRGALACQELSAPLPLTGDGSTRLIHSIDGEFSVGGHLLASGETVILDGLESAVLAPLASTVLIALCSIYQGQGVRM